MKFITPLLTLVAASTIYAKKVINLLCDNEVREIDECFQNPTINTLEVVCKIYKSEKCQKFFTDPFSVIPNCKNDELYSVMLQPLITNNLNRQYNLACLKDEVGNPCPYGEILLKEYSHVLNPLTDGQKQEAKKNTCQSNICREATYKAFFDYEAAKKVIDGIMEADDVPQDNSINVGKQEVAKYMDTEECKAMSSDASILRIGAGVFISVGLLLLSLY